MAVDDTVGGDGADSQTMAGRGAARPHGARAVGRGLRMVARAAPRELASLLVVQVGVGFVTLAEILIARRALSIILDEGGEGLGSAAPEVIAVVVLHCVGLAALAVQAERQRLLAEKTARRAMEIVLDVAGRVDQSSYDSPEFHDRLERAKGNALIRPMQLAGGMLSAVTGITVAVGVGAALLLIEPLLLLLPVASFPAIVVVARRNTGDLFALALRMTPADRRRLHLQDVLSDVSYSKEVRSYGLVEPFRARYEDLYDRRFDAIRGLVRARTRRALVAVAMTTLGLGGAVLMLGWLLSSDRLALPAAGAAMLGLVALSQRMSSLASGLSNVLEGAVFVEDILDFDRRCPPRPVPEPAPLPAPLARIAVEDVGFTYPGRGEPTLRDVSLHVAPGEVIGLVGENGSGKTTLVKLLCGLYPPSVGHIAWNGVRLVPAETPGLRDRVAVLFQDYARYQLPAGVNVGAGRAQRMDDHAGIRAAARRAGADRIVARLPEGYDSVLSRAYEGGVELSAGQWQRIALARALFRDADLLILDEPAAALDAVAERRLYEEVRALAADRAVVLVSHRVESLLTADRIYVLRDGRVVECGTHHELIAAQGPYASLFGLTT